MIRALLFSISFTALVAPTGSAQQVDTLNLLAHSRFLASDVLEGRANGTAGQHAAAEYIVAQFQRLGLEPLYPGGSFRQAIPVTRVRIDRDAARLIVRSEDGENVMPGTRFHHLGGDSLAFLPCEGRVQFVGALRRGLSNVTDAVVVADAAPGVPIDSIAAELETNGARALVLVLRDSVRYATLRHARGPDRYFIGEKIGSIADRRIPILLAHPAARDMLSKAKSVQLRHNVAFERVRTWNLAARRPGADPQRSRLAVVYTAHYDHIGYSRPINHDSLYNGFMDNAVGVAAVLGIAEALAQQPFAESAIFLLTSVEEEGSYGSAYFLTKPPVPLETMMAAINLDAGSPTAPPAKWYVEGGEHPAVAKAMRDISARGWRIESMPLQQTSDHWSFHARGVPAVFPVPGEGWAGLTREQEEAAITRWWRQHRPDDEWDPGFPLAGLQAYAQFAIDLGHALAASPEPRNGGRR
jgi:hypothetical protein